MPIDPRKKLNKEGELLKHLKRYGYVSKSMAAAKWGMYHLPQAIKRLRDRGYEIECEQTKKGARYKLIEYQILSSLSDQEIIDISKGK